VLDAAGALLELRRRAVLSSLEELLTSEQGFGLISASPLQRAICRVADGRELGELAGIGDVRAALGVDELDTLARPAELMVLSGIRTAKSLMAAAAAVRMAMTCDVSRLGHGEVPRVSVVSLTLDLARVIFGHLVGNCLAKPVLRSIVIGEPTVDTITLRHPTGRPVEIKVVAGSRAGASLVARWSAGCIFDEAPRMVGADEGVVNLTDARNAIIARLLPGAQVMLIGSPWAPFGPVYDLHSEYFGKPSARFIAVKAPAWAMNPVWWTEKRCEELKAADPDVWVTDCAADFATPEESLFTQTELSRATRELPLELAPVERAEYRAAIDPATRGNGWTLVLVTREGSKRRIVLARQWVGSRLAPLSPRAVMGEIAALLRPYGVSVVESDQWSGDALRDIGREFGLTLIQTTMTDREKTERYMALRTRTAEGVVEYPPDATLLTDMQRLKKRVTQTGVTIHLPRTSDGRHCDYAPAVLLALSRYLDDVADAPKTGVDAEVERMRAYALGKARPKDKWRNL